MCHSLGGSMPSPIRGPAAISNGTMSSAVSDERLGCRVLIQKTFGWFSSRWLTWPLRSITKAALQMRTARAIRSPYLVEDGSSVCVMKGVSAPTFPALGHAGNSLPASRLLSRPDRKHDRTRIDGTGDLCREVDRVRGVVVSENRLADDGVLAIAYQERRLVMRTR